MTLFRISGLALGAALFAACAPQPTQVANNSLGDESEVVCRKEAQTGSHRKVMVCHEHGGASMGSISQRNRMFRLGELPMSKGELSGGGNN
jgi:hypothetical protein